MDLVFDGQFMEGPCFRRVTLLTGGRYAPLPRRRYREHQRCPDQTDDETRDGKARAEHQALEEFPEHVSPSMHDSMTTVSRRAAFLFREGRGTMGRCQLPSSTLVQQPRSVKCGS